MDATLVLALAFQGHFLKNNIMRTFQHVIDTKAVRQLINSIPEHCVVRELTERDYGIDLMIELFEKTDENQHGHPIYDTTGHVCYLQIKGTEKELIVNDDSDIAFSIDKKSLYYVEKFSTPFILTRICTLAGKESINFVWLQRYIIDKLDLEIPNWREDETDSITIYIPTHNTLPGNFEKIERISYRIKYIEELSEFNERYSEILMALEYIIHNQSAFKYFDEVIKNLNRISKLSTLMSNNHCCISQECVFELIEYINGVKFGENNPNYMEDFPHNFNFGLLNTSNLSIRFIEGSVADSERDTTY